MNTDMLIQQAHENHRAGQLEKAELIYRQILSKQPSNAHINDLGNLLHEKGQLDQAIIFYKKSIEQDPSYAGPYYNLAEVCQDKGMLDEAILSYKKALELNPALSGAYYNIGAILQAKGEYDEALAYYKESLQLDSNHFDTYTAIGVILQEKDQLDEALEYHHTALQLNPNLEDAYNNIGVIMREKGKIDEAVLNYQRALQLNPYSPEIHFGFSLILLLSGKFAQGWKEHEWRLLTKEIGSFYREFNKPLWDGSDLQGQTILLHAEQGLGDTIQFIRYAPLVAQRGANVIVECQKELVSLISMVQGVHKVIEENQQLPVFDLHCPLLSLPHLLGTTTDNIPAHMPVFSVNASDVHKWQDKFFHSDGILNVGLVWAGNSLNKKDRFRSLPLEIFLPLTVIQNVVFYSLQKGPASMQVKNPPAGMEIIDYMEKVQDFSDTAALIENLDLVISVDTAVAHLAGSLGKPVWVLLPFSPDWRWMLNRQDSPWYPTMKLFRQASSRDWESVIHDVKNELRNLTDDKYHKSRIL